MTFSAAIITLIYATIAALSVNGSWKRKYHTLYIAQSVVAQFCSLYFLVTLDSLFWVALGYQMIVSAVALIVSPKMRYILIEDRDVKAHEVIMGFSAAIALDIIFWFSMVWALS